MPITFFTSRTGSRRVTLYSRPAAGDLVVCRTRRPLEDVLAFCAAVGIPVADRCPGCPPGDELHDATPRHEGDETALRLFLSGTRHEPRQRAARRKAVAIGPEPAARAP